MPQDKYLKKAAELDVIKRLQDLVAFRKDCGVETRWKMADRLMEPKPLSGDWERNFRANKRMLQSSDWQSDNADLTVFQKVHIALSVLGDQNPRASFKTNRRDFKALAPFRSAVYNWSLNQEDFKFKLKRFIHNQAKYGVAFACTKPLIKNRDVDDLVAIDEKGNETYETRRTQDFKGPWFKPLRNWQVYWDDAAEVYDRFSMRDWAYYEQYSKSQLKVLYPALDLTKLSGESTQEEDGKENKRKDLYKLFYYEDYVNDLMCLISNDKVLDAFPLPNDQHRLTLNYGAWFLRDDVRIDGIGIPEVLAQDQNLYNKINNMTVDQLVLSIYKTYFYDGTNEEDGVLTLQPGRGQQVLDPQKMRWLEVPTNNVEANQKLTKLQESMDANTFNKTLGGEALTGKTAYEVEQIKNSSLRRLASPMDGLKYALTTDAHNRMDILHSILKNSEVETITDPIRVEAALAVYKNNPEIFKWDEENAVVYRYKYPEVRLPLQKKGTEFVKSRDDNFFLLTPEGVRNEGDIEIDVRDTLLPSVELEKTQLLELSNMLIPLLAGDPATNKKPAMMLLDKANQDPNDWLPDAWLSEQPTPVVPPPELMPPDGRTRETPTMVPQSAMGRGAKSVVGKLGRLFSKINPKAITSK